MRLFAVLLALLIAVVKGQSVSPSAFPTLAPLVSSAPSLSTIRLVLTINGIKAIDLNAFGGFDAIKGQLITQFSTYASQYKAWIDTSRPLDLVMLTPPTSSQDGITLAASVPLIVDILAAQVLVAQMNAYFAQTSQGPAGSPPVYYYSYLGLINLRFTINSVTAIAVASPSPTPGLPSPTATSSGVPNPSPSSSALPPLPNSLIVLMLRVSGVNFADLWVLNNGEGWLAYKAALQSDIVRLLASAAGVSGIPAASIGVVLMGAGPEGASITPSPPPATPSANATANGAGRRELQQTTPTVLSVQVSIPITERAGSNTAAQYAQILSDALSIAPGSYLATSMAVASQVSGVVVSAQLASVPTVQPYFPSPSSTPKASTVPSNGGGGSNNNGSSGDNDGNLSSTAKIVGGVLLAVGAGGLFGVGLVWAKRRQRRYRASMAAAAVNAASDKDGSSGPGGSPSSNALTSPSPNNNSNRSPRKSRKSIVTSVVAEARRLSAGSQRMLMLISPRLSTAGVAVNNPLNQDQGSGGAGSPGGGIAMADMASPSSPGGRAPRVSMLASSLASPTAPAGSSPDGQAQRKGRSSLAPLAFAPQAPSRQAQRAAAVAKANQLKESV